MNAFILGITSALFFSITFILNEHISSTQGNFLWTASLRYLFMLPILFLILLSKKQISEVFECIKEYPIKWLTWSTVGFGLFYVPLCFAANYGEGWLVASTWQITIITGALMTPFISKEKMPMTFLKLSTIILLGIAIVQFENFKAISLKDGLYGIIPVIVGAFAYPLGNRKMMMVVKNRLNSTQRVFGMTLCSLPFWVIISFLGFHTSGIPSTNQIVSSLFVAVFSGVIATTIFFKATDSVKHNPHKLAIVEATQATEIVFTILGGVVLGTNMPTSFSILGIGIIMIGIVISNLKST